MMPINRFFVLHMSLTTGVGLAAAVSAAVPPEARDRVLELTGGQAARIVWVRNTPELTGTVMVFDSVSGKERVLVQGEPGMRIKNPFFTHDGTRIVYSNIRDKTAHIVRFDGTGSRQLNFKRPGFNFVLGLSLDEDTGEEYIYVGDTYAMTDEAFARTQEKVGGWTAGWGDGPGVVRGDHASAVCRYKLDRLDVEPELVWDKMPVGYRAVVSPDGKYLVGEMPWPRLVVATLPNGDMRQYELGCCPMLTPTGILGRLGGEHQHIWMNTWEGAYYAHPPANTMPGLTGKRDIWRPKLAANDGRFLVIKSYQHDSDGGNIYFGRFSGDFRRIEGWAQITDSKAGPDELGDKEPPVVNKEAAVWIAPKEPVALTAGDVTGAAERPAGAAASWPAHEDGLLFKWSSGNTVAEPPLAFDASGQPIFAYMLTAGGRALLGADYEMVLAHGSFEASTLGPFLARSLKEAGALGVEAYVTPQDPGRDEPGAILSFGSGDGRYAVGLFQRRDKLLLGLLTSASGEVAPRTLREIATLADARPVHLFVGHAEGTLSCYIDGKRVYEEPLAGDYANWPENPHIRFGAAADGDRDWRGRLEKVAFYRRKRSADEVAAHAAAVAAIVAARPEMERLVVEATLLRRTTTRSDGIDPYSRALGHFEYRVEQVIAGHYEAPTLHVMHWTVMNRQALPIAKRPINERYTLTLEPFDKHPQLRSELQQDDLEWDYDSPLYYDVEGQ